MRIKLEGTELGKGVGKPRVWWPDFAHQTLLLQACFILHSVFSFQGKVSVETGTWSNVTEATPQRLL